MLKHELPDLRTTMGKLAALGQRASGAITFEPVLGQGGDETVLRVSLAAIAHEADVFRAEPVSLDCNAVNLALAHAGGTLGGAFPKLSAFLPNTTEGSTLSLHELLVGGATPSYGVKPRPFKLSYAKKSASLCVKTTANYASTSKQVAGVLFSENVVSYNGP